MRKLGNRKVVRILLWFLNSIGLYMTDLDDDKLHISIHFIIFETSLVMIQGAVCIYAYINRNDFNQTVTTAAIIASGSVLYIANFLLYLNRFHCRNILRKIDKDVYKYVDEEDIVVNHHYWIFEDKRYPQKILLVFCYMFFGFSL